MVGTDGDVCVYCGVDGFSYADCFCSAEAEILVCSSVLVMIHGWENFLDRL